MTKVLLYSDQPMLVSGLESVLHCVGGYDLLPFCSTLAGLAEQLATSRPDIVLMDLTPQVTFAVLSETKRANPQTKIILWVNTISTELAYQAMGLGIRGILRRTLPIELQMKCLAKVDAGELWFEKALTDNFLSSRRVPLSQREGQLITLLSHGLKNKEIATTLSIGEGSVKVYLSRLFEKVGVKDRFELALYGLRNLTAGHEMPNEHNASGMEIPRTPLKALVLEGQARRSVLSTSLELPQRRMITSH